MEPVSAGLFAGATGKDWLMAGSSVISAALSPSPAAPSTAVSSVDQKFDFGNWTVATGQAKSAGGTSGLSIPPWAMLAAVAVVALAWKSKKN